MTKYSFEAYIHTHCKGLLLQRMKEFLSMPSDGAEWDFLIITQMNVYSVHAICTFDSSMEFLVYAIIQGKSSGTVPMTTVTKKKWIHCRGNIEKEFQDLQVVELLDDFPWGTNVLWLDDQLVPYYSYKESEQVAEAFLDCYTRFDVDPYKLAHILGLHVLEHRIQKDTSIFGQIFFLPGEASLYDAERDREIKLPVSAGTIILDPELEKIRNQGAANNTIVHECVHWVLHKNAFWLKRLYQSDDRSYICDSRSISVIEKQANQLTPRIQLPRFPLLIRMLSYKFAFSRKYDLLPMNEKMCYVIRHLAQDFHVSKQAVRIRLLQLGFLDFEGAYVYVDDHYVKPYVFEKGSLKENQTFTISTKAFHDEYQHNPDFRKILADGDYAFVDNHLVIYHEKYVRRGKSGHLELTPYALLHMQECCLVFTNYFYGNYEISSNGWGYNRNCGRKRESAYDDDVVRYIKVYKGNPTETEKEAIREGQKQEEMRIGRQMTNDPDQCMELLTHWKGKTYTQLSIDTGISTKTIERMRKGEVKPSLEKVVLLCIALHLQPHIRKELMRVFGYTLNPLGNEAHWEIEEALDTMYMEDVDVVSEYLKNRGVDLKKKD